MGFEGFDDHDAVREMISLLISFSGGTGSGKTYSALELATGLVSGPVQPGTNGKIAGIDSEQGRMKHYAKDFRFTHGKITAQFTPDAYIDAIVAADQAGFSVIVVDSASHEHAGEGGLLDWHDQLVGEAVARKRAAALKGGYPFDEYKAENAANMEAWIEPKMAHKRLVSKLVQLRAHVILCFRAEEKIEMVRLDQDGKEVQRGGRMEVRPKQSLIGADGWIPVSEKNLPYEMTLSYLFKSDNPGVPIPIKTQEQLKAFFPAGKPVTRATGVALAQWAAGDSKQPSEAVTLAGVVSAVKGAASIAELQLAGARGSGLSEDDKAVLKVAYTEQLEKLKASR